MSKPIPGRMTRREHPSRQAAIREALNHGYYPLSRADGIYTMGDGKQKIAIQRETRPRSVVFHLVEAPPKGFIVATEIEAKARAAEAAA